MPRNRPGRKLRRRTSGCLLTLLVSAALITGVVFRGVPGPLLDALMNRLSPEGGQLSAGNLAYRPGEGWILEDLKLYAAGNLVTPWLTVEEARLNPDLSRRIRKGEWTGRLDFRGGKVDTELGFWADDLVTRQPLEVEGIQGDLSLDPEGLRIHGLSGRIGGVNLNLRGELPAALFQEESDGERKEPFLPRLARHAAPVVGFLQEFQFAEPPEIQLVVRPDPEADPPMLARLELDYAGKGAHRGFEFTSLSARADYRDGVLELREVTVKETPERSLSVTGRVDFREERFTLELENTLRRYGLEALSPFALGKLLAQLQLRVQDRCDFTLKLGPSGFRNPGDRLEGRFHVADAFYKDAFFPDLSFALSYRDRVLHLTGIDGEIGQRDSRGPVEGSLLYGFDSRRIRLNLEGAFKPDVAISLVGNEAEKFIRDWEFRGAPPEFSLKLESAGRNDPMDLNLRVRATDALCRGTLFRTLEGELRMNDRELSVGGLRATRGAEVLTGSFQAPRDLSHFDIDLDSSFHVPDLAPFIGRALMEALRPFRFKGASRVELSGRVDLSGDHKHDLEGTVSFKDMIYRWVKFDTFAASFNLEDGVLAVPDIRGKLEEGTLEASFRAKEPFQSAGTFDLELDVENVDLFKVITAATDTETTPYTGTLSLDLELAGHLRDRDDLSRMASLTGGGAVAIRDGELFRVPLLLGLSRILSKVVKGFGYASQGDFSADFTIKDGVAKSDNLFLSGRVLSIGGNGFYRFDGKIGANLKVQLLSDGILSDALKLVLWPIRKLIEVQLTGTIDHPDWQPRNLPKELFGK